MQGCERKLLYEELSSGLLYLTLDHHDPIYVGFQHRVKVEICLVQGLCKSKMPMEAYTVSKYDSSLSIHSLTNCGEETTHEGSEGNMNQNSEKAAWLSFVPRKDSTIIGCHKEKSNARFGHHVSDKPSTLLRGSLSSATMQDPVENFGREWTRASGPTVKFSSLVKREKMAVADKSEESDTPKGKAQRNLWGRAKEKRKPVLLRKRQNVKKKSLDSSVLQESNVQSEKSVIAKSKMVRLPKTETIDFLKTTCKKLSPKRTETSITCDFCFTVFETKREFFKHRKLSSESEHVCDICHLSFPFRAYLLVHTKVHTESQQNCNVCDECGQSNKTVTDLKKHMISHTGEHVYKCCQCSKTFPHHHNWRNHMTVHKSTGLIRCSCCNQMFQSRAALSEHKMSLLEIRCGLCGEVFPNRASRVIHFKSQHENTILKCHICERMYSTQKELEEHTAKHGKRKRKQCPTCGRMVTNIHNHILTHKPLEEMAEAELWMCDKCPSKFRTKATLLNHLKTNHSDERSKCHLCQQSFKSYKGLYRHLNNVHSNLMPYQCEVCGKRCKLKSNLKIHMRTHSSFKMFPCSLCNQAFNYKSSLDGHMRSKHSTENLSLTVAVSSASERYSAITTSSTADTNAPYWYMNTVKSGMGEEEQHPVSLEQYYGSIA
ncbi:Zinc finger protein 836 [Plakobranchus ocellatus]|uniref:Zinc finger protein 836 n=1 Tax=Plakobranchus ocellatus TaxID=259542 RepID=A0AAV4AY70_9GAST|nr:Zinc finger protein 836 [Plakobranchus ocellatus]